MGTTDLISRRVEWSASKALHGVSIKIRRIYLFESHRFARSLRHQCLIMLYSASQEGSHIILGAFNNGSRLIGYLKRLMSTSQLQPRWLRILKCIFVQELPSLFHVFFRPRHLEIIHVYDKKALKFFVKVASRPLGVEAGKACCHELLVGVNFPVAAGLWVSV